MRFVATLMLLPNLFQASKHAVYGGFDVFDKSGQSRLTHGFMAISFNYCEGFSPLAYTLTTNSQRLHPRQVCTMQAAWVV